MEVYFDPGSLPIRLSKAKQWEKVTYTIKLTYGGGESIDVVINQS